MCSCGLCVYKLAVHPKSLIGEIRATMVAAGDSNHGMRVRCMYAYGVHACIPFMLIIVSGVDQKVKYNKYTITKKIVHVHYTGILTQTHACIDVVRNMYVHIHNTKNNTVARSVCMSYVAFFYHEVWSR